MTSTASFSRRLSRSALLLLLATGVVSGSALLMACSADADTLSGGSARTSRGKGGTTATGGTEKEPGSTSGTGSTGSPDDTSGTAAQPSGPSSSSSSQEPGSSSTPTTPPASTTTPPANTPPASTPDIDVLLATNIAKINLQETATFAVTVAPKSAFSGNVDLTVTGLPEGATATFSTPQVAVNGTAGATSTLTLKAGSAPPGDIALKIVAKSGALSKEIPATVTVAAKLIVKIPQNANTNTKNFSDITIAKGPGSVVVEWQNPTADVVQIHRQNNAAGLSHGGNIQPNASESRTVTATGNFVFYVHNGKDQASPGRLIVK